MEVSNKVDATLIFEEINKELEEYLLEKSIDTDSTDSVFDFLEALSNRVQEEFDELLARGRRGRRIYHYKIKLTLPEQKTVNIKKNDQVIKIINVRRKSKYFSTRSARMF